MGEIKDVRAVEPLISILYDPSVKVCRSTVEALGKIGDARIAAFLAVGAWIFRDALGKENIVQLFVLLLGAVLLLRAYAKIRIVYTFITEVFKL